jgi:hypothetical protein
MSLGSQLNQQVPNPFYGIVNNGVLTQPTVARGQLLRPYPQFTDIIPLYAAGAKSRYDALQITGRKRLSQGLMFEGSYTYGKASEIGMSHQDSYNLDASWALASYDIAHRFVISYLYELPFGHGRRFASGASTFVNALIGGWQFNGITTLQSGTPLSITATNTAGAAEQQRQRSTAQRSGRRSAQSLFRDDRLQPASGLHVRQRTSLLAGAAGARRAELRSVVLQELRRQTERHGAVPGRGPQCVQPGPVLGAEHERHVNVVRGHHRPGQCAQTAAVRTETVVVKAQTVPDR